MATIEGISAWRGLNIALQRKGQEDAPTLEVMLRFALLGCDRLVEKAFADALEVVAKSTGIAPIRAVFGGS